ncbi:hypothetical protein NDU88_008276 [Pleurodeles waltl]|uniref:Uncharacterized protein n=1 Tax=Pleurodeles waltl TaxID=8319 RepID=A0AAV7RSJ3_PLEWA|nr:hypothetical protein NDU88_008276 [Pleurodeles waltl]
MNLRHLSHLMHMVHGTDVEADQKAFDTIGWEHHQEVLRCMGVGEEFLSWVCPLYMDPITRFGPGLLCQDKYECDEARDGGCQLPLCSSH